MSTCKQCGGELKRRTGESPSRFSRRIFCSTLCKNKWPGYWTKPKPIPQILCQGCGKIIPPPVGYRYHQFSVRKFCSPTCQRGIVHRGTHIVQSRCYGGYVVVYVGVGKRPKYEHTIIAERSLGRPLKKGKVVHHINGIKDDNRNENLLICSSSYHRWLHAEMQRRYMLEHFGPKGGKVAV
jgi:HNH endonuclease